jgi:predicted component of type VI protein secretion system
LQAGDAAPINGTYQAAGVAQPSPTTAEQPTVSPIPVPTSVAETESDTAPDEDSPNLLLPLLAGVGVGVVVGVSIVFFLLRRRKRAVRPQPVMTVAAPAVTTSAYLEGPNGEQWELHQGENTIGRHSSNRVAIQDESISRFHAVIIAEGDRYTYRDLDTASHPSEINGELLRRPYLLRNKTVIRIGSTLVRFMQQ